MPGHRPLGALRVAMLAALLLAGVVQAQGRLPRELANYPAKAVRFVVPSSPGGGADVLARSIGLRMAEAFGKPVVIENRSGVEMVHVPYKGAGDSTAATIAGQVHLIFSSPNALMPQVKAGRLRALGVTSARRCGDAPVTAWHPGVAAPQGSHYTSASDAGHSCSDPWRRPR